MSYYILPNNNNSIIVNPYASDTLINEPIISYSLYNYYKELYEYTHNIKCDNDLSYDEIIKIINPYEFLFNKISGSNFSISKLQTRSTLFYDLLEIYNLFNLFDHLNRKKMFNLHISKNYTDSIETIEMLRHDVNDENMFFEEIEETDISKIINNIKFDFLFFETKSDSIENYIKSFTFLKGASNNCSISISIVINYNIKNNTLIFFLKRIIIF